MGITGASQHSYTVDADTQLKDAGLVAASAAGTVAAAARVLDFGRVDVNGVENIAFSRGDVILDVSAMEFDTGDETYYLVYELSDDASGGGAGFAAGDNVVARAMVLLGDTATVLAGLNMDDMGGTGRMILAVDNEVQGTVYRFARIACYVGGTIVTGINYQAWYAEKK